MGGSNHQLRSRGSSRGDTALLADIAAAINALPEVFSTPQWGGRAYKLPGPSGSRSRPRLLAFVALQRDGTTIGVGFKLPRERAEAVIEHHDWIERHSFGTLGRAGWVEASVTTKRHVVHLRGLLAESRRLFPVRDEPTTDTPVRGQAPSTGAARHIDRVMRDAAADGWRPPAGEFDA